MQAMWASTGAGELFTSTLKWRLLLGPQSFTLSAGARLITGKLEDITHVSVTPGWFWTSLQIEVVGHPRMTLDGLPNDLGATLTGSVATAVAAAKKEAARRARILKVQLAQLEERLAPVLSWKSMVGFYLFMHKERWFTEETIEWLEKGKPARGGKGGLGEFLETPEVWEAVKAGSADALAAATLWMGNLRDIVADANQKHVEAELVRCKVFFDHVEKTPLTEEQARAVVTFDNRVQVVASAGSGKTSTMVARAGYALHKKLVPADRMLLLAFNAAAAEELKERIQARLKPMGYPAEQIAARTFHAFGLDVIGQATGKKPSLAPWLEGGGDLAMLSTIVDDLKDRDVFFRSSWDLFRMVFARDLPKWGAVEQHEDWDATSKTTGFRTLGGELVKSQQERLIADWLFYHGVRYVYEGPFVVDTATPERRNYRPDFYYPDAKAFHEHFALNEKGEAPPQFKGYLDGVVWKRAVHREHRTTLWETTSASLWSGEGLELLAKNLKAAGVVLDPNPNRPVPGRKVIEHEDLVRTFRTFLTHAKSNRLSAADLRARLKAEAPGAFHLRHELFLRLFQTIREAWEKKLADERVIDFEDMLNQAADHLEAGRWASPFELVMVDEFQDASQARARLTRALVAKPGRYLFAVGDDWQSINRFAGSDLSVMTDFQEWFGRGPTLKLERTFRCPPSLCRVSSAFVRKNPQQLKKVVASQQAEHPPGVQIFQVADETRLAGAIGDYLKGLHEKLVSGVVAAGKGGKVEVFVLGRYRRDAAFVPRDWEARYGDRLSVTFMTIHGSKGLEADYVVLPRVAHGSYGFPSTMEDDPVLRLAMPKAEEHPFAEERRLFYVALTRARRGVAIFTQAHRVSPFVLELVEDHKLKISSADGEQVEVHRCAKCPDGVMVPRSGKHGRFWACNRFPACRHTANALTDKSGRSVRP